MRNKSLLVKLNKMEGGHQGKRKERAEESPKCGVPNVQPGML